MKFRNISIGRYSNTVPDDVPRPGEGIPEVQGEPVFPQDVYGGWIEGTRDDESTWIMWLDADGSPTLFWARREEDGGVVGEPIVLTAS